jgi:hypothetical protein
MQDKHFQDEPQSESNPKSLPSPKVEDPIFSNHYQIWSRTYSTDELDMLPYSNKISWLPCILLCISFSFASTWSRMVESLGCTAQNMSFQSEEPTYLQASVRIFSMFLEINLGTSFIKWKMSPAFVR